MMGHWLERQLELGCPKGSLFISRLGSETNVGFGPEDWRDRRERAGMGQISLIVALTVA